MDISESSGYDVSIKIDINGTEVANKQIAVHQYETHKQWVEREFETIEFDKSYDVEAGNTYTIKFKTLNSGSSCFMIYSIPDFSGECELSTTCTGMTYNAYEKWPAKPCLILAGDGGKLSSNEEYEQYIYKDLDKNNAVIKKYLQANWQTHTTDYTQNNNLECVVLGGTHSDGSLGNTIINFTPKKSFTGEVLRFKTAPHLGGWYPLIMDIYINNKKVSTYSPSWNDWAWETIDISPYEFVSGKDYSITFKTLNKSLSGCGLVRVLCDQQNFPQPVWDNENYTWIAPSKSQFKYTSMYQVKSLEGSDVYPDGIVINNQDYSWRYDEPYSGPGKPFLEILSCQPGNVAEPQQICYPFGSYYSQISGQKEEVSPVLKNVFNNANIDSGFAVWDEETYYMGNVKSRYSEFLIPRYLVKGNLEQSQIIKNINSLTGIQ